ncbi:MAG TPA: transglutaminase family protein [Actinomycetota bacterium]
MRFRVRHVTRYDYDRPVALGPLTVRLRPRDDGTQRLDSFSLACDPLPSGRSEMLDAEGTPVTRLWFDGESPSLVVETVFEAETLRVNPYDWVVDPDASVVPMRYAPQQAAALSREMRFGGDAAAADLSDAIAAEAGGSATVFLSLLCARIAATVVHERRPDGLPRTPAQTLGSGRGACRDVAVAFVQACRAAGLAARFVSGYTVPEDDLPGELHAWAEVYLPDGGWRGYDATGGIAVADGHIAVAAAPEPAACAPVEGTFGAGASSTLTTTVEIEAG